MKLFIVLLASVFFVFSCSESPLTENNSQPEVYNNYAGPGGGNNPDSFILKWAGSYSNVTNIANPDNALNYPDLKYIAPQPNGVMSLMNFGNPDFNEYSYTDYANFMRISESALRLGDYIAFEKAPGAHRWYFENSTWIFSDGNNSFTLNFDRYNLHESVIVTQGFSPFNRPSYFQFFDLGWGFSTHACILVDLDPYNINYNSPDFTVTMYCGNNNDLTPELEANGILVPKRDVIDVGIDIKPGSDKNPINPKSKGVIPVAILTTADFDAADVDPASVTFGPGGAYKAHTDAHLEDVDEDGDIDLLFHFRTQETGIASGDTEACLIGKTFGGQAVQGCDKVTVK